MGIFLHIALFPGGEESECRAAIQQCADDSQLNIQIEDCHWNLFEKGAAVQLNDYCCGYETLAERLSTLLSCPVMILYIYDGDYWGYDLWRKGAEVDRFASMPDYFAPGSPTDRPGNAYAVAQCFEVSPKDVERYLLPWGEENMYDCWQMADFIKALGFDYDQFCPPDEDMDQMEVPLSKPELPQESPPNPSYTYHSEPPPLPNVLSDRGYILERMAEIQDIAEEAVLLFENMEYKETVSLLTELIQVYPDRTALYLLRAFCWNYLQGTRSRKAEIAQDLEKALEIEPDNIMILRASCPTMATTRRCRLHIPYLTRLMELDPENQDDYQVNRAYRYYWVGDDDAAKADLEAVLSRGKFWTVDLTYLSRQFGLL